MSPPDVELVSWEAAVEMLLNGRDLESARKALCDAVVHREIGHRPQIAVGLEGRLNSANGEFRHHSKDRNPRYLRVVLTDVRKFLNLYSAKSPEPDAIYMPGYLALIHEAIREHSINQASQPKAETLRAWFAAKEVNGKKVSDNLAKSMTTIVRLPELQVGGARKQRPKG